MQQNMRSLSTLLTTTMTMTTMNDGAIGSDDINSDHEELVDDDDDMATDRPTDRWMRNYAIKVITQRVADPINGEGKDGGRGSGVIANLR